MKYNDLPKTLGELKKNNYTYKSIKQEIRDNLISKIRQNENIFTGIHGYDESVIPEVTRALLSGHNINLLGLRGQAKTAIARKMTTLLDEYIPIISGSEINDDPLKPISKFGKMQVEKEGDDCKIDWIHRKDRYFEKLATPDVSPADLIGDIDPVKSINQKISLNDENAIHFGMIPRANRSIFVINELPDLQARIQVSLFNILQEGDIQIRGFKFRLPLDIQFVFTANPEDYTNRGSIVTPLKDRIGSQILTHYPKSVEISKKITLQEAKLNENQKNYIVLPNMAADLLEQIAICARESEYVDHKSGVSARLTISMMENLYSTAELRMLKNNEKNTTIRLSDFLGVIPAITGKIEMVYEGEQEGAVEVAKHLIGAAVKKLFAQFFDPVEISRKKINEKYTPIIAWFDQGNLLSMHVNDAEKTYKKKLLEIEALKKVTHHLDTNDSFFGAELVLHALAEHSKLLKNIVDQSFVIKDVFNSMINFNENDTNS
jgi:magnesium chelatase subunit I